MQNAVLLLHFVVCAFLIGLVLLQRSEGGALGMGGGGGSLVSGRGAADALARMTSIAGGFFLVTSLSLTVIAGAAASSSGPSLRDIPQREQPAAPQPVQPQRPDPTESSAPEAADTQLAALGTEASGPPVQVAPPAELASERAGPLTPASQGGAQSATPRRQSQAAAAQTQTQNGRSAQQARPPAQQPRQQALSQQGEARATSGSPTSGAAPRLILPNTSGSSTGQAITPESVQTGNELSPVRRQRAGPDE
jgi:preprotein translocase subunit SecG